LDNLSSVISNTSFVGYVILLGTEEFGMSKTSIYPNPFSSNFNIDSKESISNYSIFDITGKQLISTISKNELDKASSQLHTGIYFLKLQFENGKTGSYKLVKK